MSKINSIQALRLFVRAADLSSFSQAAAELSLLPSSATRHIASLESSLGCQLFNRNHRAVHLTESGQTLYEAAREALELLDLTADNLGHQDPQGLLRISSPPTFAKIHLIGILSRFQETYPRIETDVRLTETVADPIEANVDVAIRIGEIVDSRLIARPLARQKSALCASAEYLRLRGTPNAPADLKQHNCLIYHSARGPQHWHVEDAQHRFKVLDLSGTVASNSAEYLVESALADRGLVLFPTWILNRHLAEGRLVPVLNNYTWTADPHAQQMHLVYPANRQKSPKTRAFIDFLIDAIGSPPYWDSW